MTMSSYFLENLDEQCRGSNGDTRRCSLCDSETVQKNSKFDVDQPWTSDSKGIVNSPSDDLSTLDVNLMDDRDQQSVQYVVETGLSNFIISIYVLYCHL